MKLIFQKVFSIIMVLFLIASTVSWTIGLHFCGKSLVDIAFFDHAKICGMDQSSNGNSETTEWNNMSCCASELAVIVGQDDVTTFHFDSSIVQQFSSIASNASYALFIVADELVTSYNTYSPPTLVRDLQLFDRVFLI
ncbi:HYC_CC_PP family protein [Sediminicola arcticus]|jgi:hypothetical protein|uniref:Secreted protein n=1 Tax=Sediminicola arcticus TaxID=1574308 RepID=A0ABV2SW33_9FLAO